MSPRVPGRILALDYGKRRIGLAISDELGLTAQGLETLERTRLRDDIQRLAAIAADRGVSLFLLGDPIHLSGESSAGSHAVREFAARLHERTSIPVKFWDERFTTVQAQRVLRESGVSSRKRSQAVDRLAAVLILENFLDHREGGPG